MRAHLLISRAIAVSALALPSLSAQSGPTSEELRELIRKEVRAAVQDALDEVHALAPSVVRAQAKGPGKSEGHDGEGESHVVWVDPDGHARVEVHADEADDADAEDDGHEVRVFEVKGNKGVHAFGQGKPLVLRAEKGDGERVELRVEGTAEGKVRRFAVPGGHGALELRKIIGDGSVKGSGHGGNFVFRLGDDEKGHVFSGGGAKVFSFGASASGDEDGEDCCEQCTDECCSASADSDEHGADTKVIEVRAAPAEKGKGTVKKARRIHV